MKRISSKTIKKIKQSPEYKNYSDVVRGPLSDIFDIEEPTHVLYQGQQVPITEFHKDGKDKNGRPRFRKHPKNKNNERIKAERIDMERNRPWVGVRQDAWSRACQFAKERNITLLVTQEEVLGTIEKFKSKIEKQFHPGMNWWLHGNKDYQWNIDHIDGLIYFAKSIKTKEGQLKYFGLNNLQPLWREDHVRKTAEEKKAKVIQ